MNRADQRKFHFIYKTTCRLTGRFYIGMHSTDDMEDGYLGSGKRLWYSIKKHGKENHVRDILEMLPDRESLRKKEQEIVNEKLVANVECMNLDLGGNYIKHSCKSNAVKRTMSEAAQEVGKRPEIRELRSKIAKAQHADPIKSQRHREATKRAQNHPVTKKHQAEASAKPEVRKRRSVAAKISQNRLSQKRLLRKAVKGRIWISDGTQCKMIRPKNLKQYLNVGWFRGRKY